MKSMKLVMVGMAIFVLCMMGSVGWTANIEAKLGSADGSDSFVVQDSGAVAQFWVNSDGNAKLVGDIVVQGSVQGAETTDMLGVFGNKTSSDGPAVELYGDNHSGSFDGQIRIISGDGGATGADIVFIDYNGSSWDQNMVVEPDGDVGIGEGEPTARLEIDGSTSDNTAYALDVQDSGDSSILKVRNDGMVGIGIDNPLYQLQVHAYSGDDAAVFMTDDDVAHGMTDINATNVFGAFTVSSGTGGGLKMQGLSDTDVQGMQIIGAIGIPDPGDLMPAISMVGYKKNGTTVQALGSAETVFSVSNAGAAADLVVLGNGNVGVGTNNPVGKLEISGGMLIQETVTIAADDVTPDVSGGNMFKTSANTGATAITDLDLPQAGQIVYIIGGSDTNASTIADSGNFNLSAAFTANQDDVLVLLVVADNDYIEIGRVDN